jgi:hypothetical protein
MNIETRKHFVITQPTGKWTCCGPLNNPLLLQKDVSPVFLPFSMDIKIKHLNNGD